MSRLIDACAGALQCKTLRSVGRREDVRADAVRSRRDPIATLAWSVGSGEPRFVRELECLIEARVVRVTPFRFDGPEAGETAKILRRALSESITKAAPIRDW